ALRFTPAGYTMTKLASEHEIDELKQEAARILLAGAQAPWSGAWEVDPFALRREKMALQRDRLSTATDRWVRSHLAGERVGSRWRWRHDLLAAMIADGTIMAADARDPWERKITTEHLVEVAALGSFDFFAQQEMQERLRSIYLALSH